MQLRRTGGSIVGRSEDIRAVRDALDAGPLLSLIGPGGVGKTALAAEVINEVEPDFDRVVPVELAEADRGDVGRLLGAVLLDEPTADVDRMLAALAATSTLVVIDNCEHVIDEVADLVTRIATAGQETKILATSRRPLGVAGEITWTVRPLSVPQDHRSDDELTSAEAVQLFLERVRQAVPTFELTDSNRPMVAEICIAADGVPLVLELAAALVRSRPLDEILQAMTHRPAGLEAGRRDRPEHQRSLIASLDWSRRFLPSGDARFLDRLSVFVGGFTAEAARSVDPDRTGDGLARLVDHSLVGFDPATGRYRMLEVVRLDAERRLDPAEHDDARRAHLEACLVTVSRIAADRYEADPDNLFPRYERELPNLCAALRRCRESNDLDGFRALLGPIAVWWVHYVAPDDPQFWEEAFAAEEVPTEWQGNVISALSFYWSHRGHHERALSHARRAVAIHREAGAPIAWSLDETSVGNAHLALGDRAAASAAYGRALDAALASGHPYPELAVRVSLARLDPDGDEAVEHLTAAKGRAPGFGAIESLVTTELGLQALRAGRTNEARRLCDESVAMARRTGYAEGLASALCGRADVGAADGDHGLARALFDEALLIGRRSVHQGVIRRATEGLDRMPPPVEGPPPVGPGGVELSERELSVARLLRGDLTQREIADELYIAPSTVKTHIKSIYRKLNVTKRSYAVTRAAELGLFD